MKLNLNCAGSDKYFRTYTTYEYEYEYIHANSTDLRGSLPIF
jgi:hypothetical protein